MKTDNKDSQNAGRKRKRKEQTQGNKGRDENENNATEDREARMKNMARQQ